MFRPDESNLSNCPFELPDEAEIDSPAEKTTDRKKLFFLPLLYVSLINSGWGREVTTPLDNVEEQIHAQSQSHGCRAGANILSGRRRTHWSER